jgi:hypothetical protein
MWSKFEQRPQKRSRYQVYYLQGLDLFSFLTLFNRKTERQKRKGNERRERGWWWPSTIRRGWGTDSLKHSSVKPLIIIILISHQLRSEHRCDQLIQPDLTTSCSPLNGVQRHSSKCPFSNNSKILNRNFESVMSAFCADHKRFKLKITW